MKTLSIFAIIISISAIIFAIVAITISIFSIKFDTINETNYIAIAATILTGAVTFAVCYNIYTNLYASRKAAKDVAEETAKNIVEGYITKAEIRMSNYVIGSHNYGRANIYYELGRIREELRNEGYKVNALESYKEALKSCNEARNYFVICEQPDMIKKCDDFINEINEKLKESRT